MLDIFGAPRDISTILYIPDDALNVRMIKKKICIVFYCETYTRCIPRVYTPNYIEYLKTQIILGNYFIFVDIVKHCHDEI